MVYAQSRIYGIFTVKDFLYLITLERNLRSNLALHLSIFVKPFLLLQLTYLEIANEFSKTEINRKRTPSNRKSKLWSTEGIYSFSKFLFQATKLINTCDSNLYTENMWANIYFVKRPWIKRPLK